MDFRPVISILVLFLCVHLDSYSAVKIEITPQKAAAEKDKEVTVRCTMNETDAKATEMLAMKIARKGGRALVIMHSNSTITYMEATEEEVTVTGKIGTGASIKDSFLQMVIKDPDSEDTGLYICNFRYNETAGVTKMVKGSMILTVKASDVNDMDDQVKQLLEQVKEEEKQIKNMEEKEKKTKKLVPDLEKKAEDTDKNIKKLAEKEEKVNTKMADIEDKAMKQLKKIEELSKKEETEVKSLKSAVDGILNKRKKKKDDMKEIDGKKTETKVKTLEGDVEKKTKDIADLEEKEKQVEKKVNDLAVKTKSAVKKIKEFVTIKLNDKKQMEKVDEKMDKKVGELADLLTKETQIEDQMTQLEEKMAEAVKQFEFLKKDISDGIIDPDTDTETDTSTETDPNKSTNPDDFNDSYEDSDHGNDMMSAFAATTQQKYVRLQAGKRLILSDIIMQAGLEGYSPKTGIYTVPVDGLYQFSLSIKVNCVGCYSTVAIKAYSKIVARLMTGTLYDELQNSINTVVQLNKGTEVMLDVQEASGGVYLTAYRLCLFSGYLIAPIT